MSTICFTGMDRAEETKLKLLLSEANEWLGGAWHLVPEAQAHVLVVDLESIYGHMTWLKVHNSGKYLIALTSRAESEADHMLLRPVTVDALVEALSQVTAASKATATPSMTAAQAMASAREAGAHIPGPTPHREVQERSPQPAASQSPYGIPSAVPNIQQPMPQQSRAAPTPAAASLPKAPPQAPPPSRPVAPPRSRDSVLWDYLQAGGLPGPSRLAIDGAPALVVDPQNDTYLGGPNLKPYLPYCELGSVRADQWQPIAPAEFAALKPAHGQGQPLARLRWLHALVQGGGHLATGYDPGDKFHLTKWPKTEREYPRHLRIATAMMQAPATPAELAAQSDVVLADVNDFINASLDSGYAEVYAPPPSTPQSGAKSGGLLGRLRGLRNG